MTRRPVLSLFAATTVFACGALAACASSASPATPPTFSLEDGLLTVTLEHGTLAIDPATLGAIVTPAEGAPTVASISALQGEIDGKVSVKAQEASWALKDGTGISARIINDASSVSVSIDSPNAKEIEWPVSSPDNSTGAIQFANGSGQNIPIRDEFWTGTYDGLVGSEWSMTGDLTLPAWGVTSADETSGVAFYTTTDIGTSLSFDVQSGAVVVAARHTPTANVPYTVVVTPTDGSPVAAAGPYRDHLQRSGQFKTLSDKSTDNPNVARLIGAPHAYVWGTGREQSFLGRLQDAGIQRAWLGYDADNNAPGPIYVSVAQDRGLLVAPYDTWDNAQDPDTADTPSSVWPANLYPDGCVRNEDGSIVEGFGGRGCYLSTAALEQAEKEHGVLTARVQDFTAEGQLSYFLDVDAAGQLFTDHSDPHPQSQEQDRARRLSRMHALTAGVYSAGAPLVLGSETAAAWANSALAYSHGSSTPVFDGLWEAQNNGDAWGGYWPEDRPKFFFQGADLPADLATAMFDPRYRIPLYQAALHDSVITTDRWEIDTYKVNGQSKNRALMAMLHNSPLNYVWDNQAWDTREEEILRVNEFFAAIQEAAGFEPLTHFEVLTEQRDVQRSTFAGGLKITANFGTTESHGVDAGCVTAVGDGVDERLCL